MVETNVFSWPGWETVGLIGRGSFGAVYEIRRNVLGNVEKAALKVISIPQSTSDIDEMYNDGYDDESITSTFQAHLKSIVAEYALMRKMNGCSNIVNCDDVRYVQHDDGIGWDIYIKMELLTPLAKALPDKIPEDMVTRMARDICTALILCQKHGIIHRDIKPQNIFISDNGDYKLGDFGVAKTVEKTTGGTKIGTYKYMAPEVYNNQPYGAGADIYSLGLVLYWMLNERRLPFLPLPPEKLRAGMDENARNRRLAGEAFGPPKHGSAALKKIIMKACAYDAAMRYHSAQEMLDDLDKVQGAAPILFTHPIPDGDMTAGDATLGLWGRSRTVVSPAPSPASVEPEPNPDPVPPVNEPPKKKKKGIIGLIIGGVLAVILIVIFLLLRSCDANQLDKPVDDPVISTTAPAPSISLSSTSLELLPGDTLTLKATKPAGADVTWSTSDKSVATVSGGKVTAVAAGTAQITAKITHGGKDHTATCIVTVSASSYEPSISLDSSDVTLSIGDTITLKATKPAGADVTWSSSNKSVATVSGGKVTAVAAGTAEITAKITCGGKDYTATCTVTVPAPSSKPSISLDRSNVTLAVGDTITLKAAKPKGVDVTWSSSDKSVATVSGGKVTAVAPGTAKITAKITCDGKDYTATCTVTVPAPSISLDRSRVTLAVGDTITLKATKPAGADVTWSTSDKSVATVSGGKVTAVGSGTAKITAKITYGGKEYSATCTVTVSVPEPEATISLDRSDVTLAVGETVNLKVTKPANTWVSWSSSNKSVATVRDGKVTAVGSGTATITAKITYGEKEYTANCIVRVEKINISVTASSQTITYAEREQDRETCTLTANVNPDGGSVKWESSNPSVATVSGKNQQAVVTAVSKGTAIITATYSVNGTTVKDSCEITVKKAASTLKVENTKYSKKGTLSAFTLSGTISSNYALNRIELRGTAKSNGPLINAIFGTLDLSPTTYIFDHNIYTYSDGKELSEFFKEPVRDLFAAYSVLVNALGGDNSVTVVLYATIYDSSNNSYDLTMSYVLTGP